MTEHSHWTTRGDNVVYLVSEDSRAGFEFWKLVFKEFTTYNVQDCMLNDSINYSTITKIKSTATKPIVAVSSCGCGNIKSTIKQLDITNKDLVILVYDNITKDTDDIQQINGIYKYFKEQKINYIKTFYRCFEEIFLSYPKFMDKSKVDSALGVLVDAYKEWETNPQGDRLMKFFTEVKSVSGIEKTLNLERAFHQTLSRLTSKMSNYTCVGKKIIGKCWFSNCIGIEDSSCIMCREKAMTKCQRSCIKDCTLFDGKVNTKDKLRMLNRLSVLNKGSISFDELQKYVEKYINS